MKRITLLLAALIAGSAFASGYVPPDVAFGMDLAAVGPGRYVLEADVMPGFALYQDKVKFQVEGGKLRNVRMPAGTTINDPDLGEERVFGGHVMIPIDLEVQAGHGAPTLVVRYQGCKIDEMCYPPQTVRFPLVAR